MTMQENVYKEIVNNLSSSLGYSKEAFLLCGKILAFFGKHNENDVPYMHKIILDDTHVLKAIGWEDAAKVLAKHIMYGKARIGAKAIAKDSPAVMQFLAEMELNR